MLRSHITQIFVGIIVSAVIVVLPPLLVHVIAGSIKVKGDAGIGIAYFIAFAGPFVVGAYLIITLFLQAKITILFKNAGCRTAAFSVWLVYPLLGLVAIGNWAINENHKRSAAREDYSRRELPNLQHPVRHVLMVNSSSLPRNEFVDGRCSVNCVSALKLGDLESIAEPTGGAFAVFRYHRGKECNWKPVEIRDAIPATKSLAEAGHFNQCITKSIEPTFAFDVKINYGRDFARPYGPCCNVAEIFAKGSGKTKLVARWEAGDGKYSHGAPFNISNILEPLIGKTLGQNVTEYSTLVEYPAESTDAELARLATLVGNGAYIHSWEAMAEWIRRVLRKETRQQGVKSLDLSPENITRLRAIAPKSSPYPRDQFFERIGIFLTPGTIARIQEADMNSGNSSN
jgi:hypothetical protein